ncbi:MAG: hypothetical protein AMXMBFR7_25620 [Planctomycetota bacterium]
MDRPTDAPQDLPDDPQDTQSRKDLSRRRRPSPAWSQRFCTAIEPARSPLDVPRDWEAAQRELRKWEDLLDRFPYLEKLHPGIREKLRKNNTPPEPERTPAKPPAPPDAVPGGLRGSEFYEIPLDSAFYCKASASREHNWTSHPERGSVCCLCRVRWIPVDGGPASPEDLFDREGGLA